MRSGPSASQERLRLGRSLRGFGARHLVSRGASPASTEDNEEPSATRSVTPTATPEAAGNLTHIYDTRSDGRSWNARPLPTRAGEPLRHMAAASTRSADGPTRGPWATSTVAA